MKLIKLLSLLLILDTISITAQPYQGGMGLMFMNNYKDTTVTGKTLVQAFNSVESIYYIDTNNDSKTEFQLSFGPTWYNPIDSKAERSKDGDNVTIKGAVVKNAINVNSILIVYEINGLKWRDPFNPFWNNVGMPGQMFNNSGGCMGYAWGGNNLQIQKVSLQGIAAVDETFFMAQYYLDENKDGNTDYYLNFGPIWYQPKSGAVRPKNGESISIVGGKIITSNGIPMILVYEINGKVWRDSNSFVNHFGGMWVNRNNASGVKIKNPFDDDDFIMMNPGWNTGMGMGMMFSDSLFYRMLELNPQNIPNTRGNNAFCGFEIGIFNTDGTNGMWQNGNWGGRMNFGSLSKFQIHYDDMQLNAYDIDEKNIKAKYWDNGTNNWTTLSDAIIDRANKTVTFSSNIVSNYVILTGEKIITAVDKEQKILPDNYSLEQNYPNPFNPATTISYTLPIAGSVTLKVFDITGKEVRMLANGYKVAGKYSVTFNASDLASGIYFYQIITPNFVETKKLILMK